MTGWADDGMYGSRDERFTGYMVYGMDGSRDGWLSGNSMVDGPVDRFIGSMIDRSSVWFVCFAPILIPRAIGTRLAACVYGFLS